MIRHIVNFILAMLPPAGCFAFRRLLLRIARVGVSDNVSFCGRGWIYGRGPLIIGAGSWLSPGTKLYTHLDASIEIGAECDIGPEVSFITGSHRFGPAARRAGEGFAKSIVVGDGCWIGARSVILGGVSIGAGSVIAAGSVVTVNIPPHSLAAGVPAMVKRQLP